MLKKLFAERRARIAILLTICAAAIGGLGCATIAVSERRAPYVETLYDGQFHDTIFAAATLDAAFEKKLACLDAIAFLGKSNTYILTTGGQKLLTVSRELGGDNLELVPVEHALLYENGHLWGDVKLAYSPRPGRAILPTAAAARAFGFTANNSGRYELTLHVEGIIQPALHLDEKLLARFSRPREIEFVRQKVDKNTAKRFAFAAEQAVLYPLALVADVTVAAGVVVIGVPLAGVLALTGNL